MATFKHFFNSGTIGDGTIKFRHFSQTEPLPQLATPQNVTASGTVVSFDAVTNAEKYEIFADGVSIGEYTPEPPDYRKILSDYGIDVSDLTEEELRDMIEELKGERK